MSNLKERQMSVIYSKDGVTITKYIFPNLFFCSFLEYEDANLCYSIEISNIALMLQKDEKFQEINLRDIDDKAMIEFMLKRHHVYLERYEEGIKLDEPETAFLFCQKRDYAKQYYKAFYSNKFSEKALYDYAKKLYCYSEDGYGYELLGTFLEILRYKLGIEVTTQLKLDLKNYIQEDGTVVVYRGFNKHSREDGISYTLDYDIAKFFAKRWDSEDVGYINKYKVNLKDISAYISSEKEIVATKAILLECDI